MSIGFLLALLLNCFMIYLMKISIVLGDLILIGLSIFMILLSISLLFYSWKKKEVS